MAIDLVRSWSFDRPTSTLREPREANEIAESDEVIAPLPSPTAMRRPGLVLAPHMKRRSSIAIDMEVPSDPSTRATSPELDGQKSPTSQNQTLVHLNGNQPKGPSGLGSLMKSAKQDVAVPEFDMNAFF